MLPDTAQVKEASFFVHQDLDTPQESLKKQPRKSDY
jgi:hypothetical protein